MLFGVLAVSAGLQLALQTRRVGSRRFRLVGDRPGSAEWWDGVFIFSAFVCAGAAPVLDLLGTLRPFGLLDGAAWHVLGIVLWLLGAAVARGAQTAMGRSWRIGVEPSEQLDLVTAGPFRVVRNPIYTGLFVLLIGGAFIVPNVVAWASVALAIVGFEILVRRVEEPYMIATHPEYRDYCHRVGRFLPFVGREA